jgi:hypothetical protein
MGDHRPDLVNVQRVEYPAPRDARSAVGGMADTARRPRRDALADPPRGPECQRDDALAGRVDAECVFTVRFDYRELQ